MQFMKSGSRISRNIKNPFNTAAALVRYDTICYLALFHSETSSVYLYPRHTPPWITIEAELTKLDSSLAR